MKDNIPNPDPSLWNDNLKPVPEKERTWNQWHLAALWVGMAVCIPTYMLASFMIKAGLSWVSALVIVGLANVLITLPMVLNGHAGVKYGLSFPVIGRAAFGIRGIYLPSVIRAMVACGWFGVQTWVGGLAVYSIWNALTGSPDPPGLNAGEFISFFIFWCINLWFIMKGTESIKWLENLSAPFLILIGVLLIAWGANGADGMGRALSFNEQLQHPGAEITAVDSGRIAQMILYPIVEERGKPRAKEYQYFIAGQESPSLKWEKIALYGIGSDLKPIYFHGDNHSSILSGKEKITVRFRDEKGHQTEITATVTSGNESGAGSQVWTYVLWLTAMMGFWATMSISISDITRYSRSQRDQVAGQFIGLPGTMLFYSFAGIFVTCAAVATFQDVLVSDDAPWDPVKLISRFDNPALVIFAQFCLIIATLTTNIAANVIAPANVFSNLFPSWLSFKGGGLLTGLIGIAICPWWLLDHISNLLLIVSAFLGPVVAILLCDYFVIRKTVLNVPELYQRQGMYAYGKSGVNSAAMIALFAGVGLAVAGGFIPLLEPLYKLAWFTGFSFSFVVYWALMRRKAV